MKTKLTKSQKEVLEPLVENTKVAHVAFQKASEMEYRADKKLWAQIRKYSPDAVRINLEDDDWYLIEKKKEDAT